MVLSALIVLAIYQLYKWGERNLRGIPWTAIFCMSGAILTKGPVGMVLPCLVVGVFLWIRTGRFWHVFGKFVAIGLGACALPMLWYLAAWRQGGDEFLTLVIEENVLRFLGKMSYESHENPLYYNFLTVFAGYVPYTLLALLSLFALKYRKPDWNLRRAMQALLSFPERNLFLRGLVPLVGYPTATVWYDRHERFAGTSKYPLNKMLNFAIEGITSFSVRPLRYITYLGAIFILLSFVAIIYALCSYASRDVLPGWTSLLISVWFVGGMILLACGIIGEYLGKIYTEAKRRPRYFIEQEITDERPLPSAS